MGTDLPYSILGIGNDIIEIARVKSSIERYSHRFLDRVFTQKEQEYCLRHRDSALNFAGRFAAKEAVVKALGTGFRGGLDWLDIEILNDGLGKPCVYFSDKAKEKLGEAEVMITISHCREYATAFAVRVK